MPSVSLLNVILMSFNLQSSILHSHCANLRSSQLNVILLNGNLLIAIRRGVILLSLVLMNVVAPLMLLPEERRGDGPLKVSTSQTRIVFKDLK